MPYYRLAGRTKLFRETDVPRLVKAVDAIGKVPTFIYFVEMEGHIKIGRADNWWKRVADLRTSSPFKVRLLLVLKSTHAGEKELHRLFAAHRVRGEWFKDHSDIRLYIKRRLHRNVNKRETE